jgi:uncharacterized iron-regulated protein
MTPRPPTAASLALLALLASSACTPRADPRLVAEPIAARRWVSPLHRDHPLVGRIWDARAARFTDEAALSAAVAGADVVLLGEVHDNVDHHLLQARLLRAVLASGRRPALVLEMLTADQQPAVDASLGRAPRDPDALAKAVDWKHSRWPEFSLYRPIFQAALDAGAPIVAGNLPRKVVREVVSKGAAGLAEPLRARLAKDEPLPAEIAEAMRAEMRESHCGELPEVMLDPLVVAQRARDAQMSERLLSAGDRGAVLIAGKGHVRTDRGVPAYVRADAPGRKVVAVGFVEVDPDERTVEGQHDGEEKGPLPYDFAVFTPGEEREDPCEPLRERSRHREKAR